jgi:hypothetical protein
MNEQLCQEHHNRLTTLDDRISGLDFKVDCKFNDLYTYLDDKFDKITQVVSAHETRIVVVEQSQARYSRVFKWTAGVVSTILTALIGWFFKREL